MDNTRLDKLFAKHDIKPENIVCVSHSGKHTLFHLLDGQEIHSTAMFKEVREYLSPDIFWNVTVQYPHSYGQKSIENCLRQWDFCLQAHVFIRSAQ